MNQIKSFGRSLLAIGAGLLILVFGALGMILEIIVFLLVGFVVGGILYLLVKPVQRSVLEILISCFYWFGVVVVYYPSFRRRPKLTLKAVESPRFWRTLWTAFKTFRKSIWLEAQRSEIGFADWLALTETALGGRG